MRTVIVKNQRVQFPDDWTDEQIDVVVQRDFFGKPAATAAAPEDFNLRHRRTDGLPGDKVNFVEPTLLERYASAADAALAGTAEGLGGMVSLPVDLAGLLHGDPAAMGAEVGRRVATGESLLPTTDIATRAADDLQRTFRKRHEEQGVIRPGAITDVTDSVARTAANVMVPMAELKVPGGAAADDAARGLEGLAGYADDAIEVAEHPQAGEVRSLSPLAEAEALQVQRSATNKALEVGLDDDQAKEFGQQAYDKFVSDKFATASDPKTKAARAAERLGLRSGLEGNEVDAFATEVASRVPGLDNQPRERGVFERLTNYGYKYADQALREHGPVARAVAEEAADIHATTQQNVQSILLALQKANSRIDDAEWLRVGEFLDGQIQSYELSEDGRDLAFQLRQAFDDVADVAEAAGVMMWDKELGKLVPFKRRKDYYPHFREGEPVAPVFVQLNDPNFGTKQQSLRQRRHIESDNFKKDPREVVPEYFKRAFRDLEETKRFGADLGGEMQRRINAAIDAGEDGLLVKEFLDKEYGHGGYAVQSEEGVARALTTYQAASKMSFSAIGNTNQFATLAANAGLGRTAKNALRTAKHLVDWHVFGKDLPEATEHAIRSGAALESAIRYILPSNATGWMAKFAEKQLAPFRWTETWLRVSSAAAGQEFARDLARVASGKPVTWAERMIPNLKNAVTHMPVFKAQSRALEQLKKMGVNVDNLKITGELTDQDLKNAGFYMSHKTQYGTRAADLPLWWSSTHNPWKRVAIQFQGVGLRMWHSIVDDVVKPGLKGDLRPAIAYATASAGIGGAGQALLDAIKSEEPKSIKEYLWNGAVANATNNFVVQTLKDVYEGGSKGGATGVGVALLRRGAGVSGRTLENVGNAALGPIVSAIRGGGGPVDMAQTAAEKYGKAIPKLVTSEWTIAKKISQNIKNHEERADAEKVFRVVNELPDGEILATVQQIVDGDTLDAQLPNGKTERLRLLNVDAPESYQPRGAEAKENLRALAGKEIKINPKARDEYGRLIVKALAGDKDVNLEQVKRGLAWHSNEIAKDQALMERIKYFLALRYAKLAKNGVWQDSAPEEPEKARARHKAATP